MYYIYWLFYTPGLILLTMLGLVFVLLGFLYLIDLLVYLKNIVYTNNIKTIRRL